MRYLLSLYWSYLKVVIIGMALSFVAFFLYSYLVHRPKPAGAQVASIELDFIYQLMHDIQFAVLFFTFFAILGNAAMLSERMRSHLLQFRLYLMKMWKNANIEKEHER
jgi:hypothetical protein